MGRIFDYDPKKYGNKKVVSWWRRLALDWSIFLAGINVDVTLVTRNEFRGALDSVKKLEI